MRSGWTLSFFLLLSVCDGRVSGTPSPCRGGESFRVEIQGSVDGGYSWVPGSATVYGAPAQAIDLMIRTRMTVTSGQTQGWSYSLEHDPSELEYYSGAATLSAVSTAGTGTETVKYGGPPDTNETDIRSGYDGCTQGIVIDNGSAVTLGPVSGFVTSQACYSVTLPQYSGSYTLPVFFSHDVGSPSIESVITQDQTSNFPCAADFQFDVFAGSGYPTSGGCSIAYSAAATGGPQLQVVELLNAGGQAPLAAHVAGRDFIRGDANADGNVDISDAVFVLGFLFQGGTPPQCGDAADADDSESFTITDPIFLLSHLFQGTDPPPAPFPGCGPDLTGPLDPEIDCRSYPDFACDQTDSDGDGLTDAFAAILGTSSTTADLWGPGRDGNGVPIPDGVPDGWDTDRDGFSDAEEILPTGVPNSDCSLSLNIADLGADPLVPDIFLEIDWFEAADHSHQPLQTAIDAVVEEFTSPLFPIEINGNQVLTPISLHVDLDEALPEEGVLQTPACSWSNKILSIRAQSLAPDRQHVFYYGLFSHVLAVQPDGTESFASGASGIPGIAFTASTGALFWEGLDIVSDCAIVGQCDAVGCCDGLPDLDPLDQFYAQVTSPTLVPLDCPFLGGAVIDETIGICGTTGVDWNGQNGCEPAAFVEDIICESRVPLSRSSTTGQEFDRCKCVAGQLSCNPNGWTSVSDWETFVLGEPRRSGERGDPCAGGGGAASTGSEVLCYDDGL